MSDEQIIFIGKKPTMNYVLAVVTEFNTGVNEVVIKARGKLTAKAIDVAEIVKNRFTEEQDIAIANLVTNTEVLPSRDGRDVKVSSLEITMKKRG